LKTYNSLDDFKVNFKTVVTIGTFDGVHLGHRYIINQLNKIAEREGAESVLLTFSPHPRIVLQDNDDSLKLIDTLEEKKKKLEKIGLDHLIIQNFTREFSRIKHVNFVRDILIKKLNVDHLVIGYDHHFGRNREGSIKELSDLSELYNFKLEQIPPQKDNDTAVSSTKIRKLIGEGNISMANKYLCHNYILIGKVIDGKKIGRKIGFPTANIQRDKNKLLPKAGVYAVEVEINSSNYYAMLNIGQFDNKVEAHIFDFSSDIYGKEIMIKFCSWIRDPMIFDNNLELKQQLKKDEKAIRTFFK
tara:strand:- start:1568 stop:2473 length:906 start_codon:yes stop_codon:yes gene_type:complete